MEGTLSIPRPHLSGSITFSGGLEGRIHCVDQADLEFRDPPASGSQLGLKAAFSFIIKSSEKVFRNSNTRNSYSLL